jgi:hypothetical protein
VSRMAVGGGRERGHGVSWEGFGRSGVAIEMAIALLLLNPLAGPYEPALMPGIPLVRRSLLSLGCGRRTRHATLLTQSDFRVSERAGGGTSRDSDWRRVVGALFYRREGSYCISATGSICDGPDLGDWRSREGVWTEGAAWRG